MLYVLFREIYRKKFIYRELLGERFRLYEKTNVRLAIIAPAHVIVRIEGNIQP